MRFLNLSRNLISGFADDNEIQLYCPERFGIGTEGVKIHTARKSLDFGNGIQYILNSFFPISR